MAFRKSYILIFVVLVVLLPGCRRHPKKISRGDMISIYKEMLLTDQAVREDREMKKVADTSLVYEGIFEKYGYNTDDYIYSVSIYLKSPDKFSKLLKAVARDLESEAELMQKQVDFIDKVEQLRGVEGVALDSLLAVFSADSFYIGRPEIIVDRFLQLSFRDRDSVAVAADSLLVEKVDSL